MGEGNIPRTKGTIHRKGLKKSLQNKLLHGTRPSFLLKSTCVWERELLNPHWDSGWSDSFLMESDIKSAARLQTGESVLTGELRVLCANRRCTADGTGLMFCHSGTRALGQWLDLLTWVVPLCRTRMTVYSTPQGCGEGWRRLLHLVWHEPSTQTGTKRTLPCPPGGTKAPAQQTTAMFFFRLPVTLGPRARLIHLWIPVPSRRLGPE